MTVEDNLLRKYLETRSRGVVITEVRVTGGDSWESGGRRIDAIRVFGVRPSEKLPRISRHTDRKKDIGSLLKKHGVEVIEVKRWLGRTVVGQAIVGAELVKLEFRPKKVTKTVVCGKDTKLIRAACRKLGVRVWLPTR